MSDHDPMREQIAQQFRFAMQLGACDPSDCPLCDCNMDDEGRAQIASIANQQADLVIARVVERERGSNFQIDTVIANYRKGRADALAEAREAVAALAPRLSMTKREGGYDCCGCSSPDDLHADALAAIDALRGGNE